MQFNERMFQSDLKPSKAEGVVVLEELEASCIGVIWLLCTITPKGTATAAVAVSRTVTVLRAVSHEAVESIKMISEEDSSSWARLMIGVTRRIAQ